MANIKMRWSLFLLSLLFSFVTPLAYADFTVFNIGPTSYQQGVVGQSFSLSLSASGGVQPLTWSIVSGTLPDGLGFDPSSGLISGVPTIAGSFPVTVQV